MKKYIYIWLPIVLFIYLLVMFFMFKDQNVAEGKQTQTYIIFGAEILILIALSYFLKKRYFLRNKREQDHNISPDKNNDIEKEG